MLAVRTKPSLRLAAVAHCRVRLNDGRCRGNSLHRLHDGKSEVQVYDYAGLNAGYGQCRRMSKVAAIRLMSLRNMNSNYMGASCRVEKGAMHFSNGTNSWTGKQVAAALCIPASKVSRSLALLRLPDEVQHQVDEGQIAARTAYELSRLPDDSARAALVNEAATGELTHTQAAQLARQRRQGKKRPRHDQRAPGVRLTFQADDDWRVVVHASRGGTYHDVQQAMLTALEEVRHRIANNVQLL